MLWHSDEELFIVISLAIILLTIIISTKIQNKKLAEKINPTKQKHNAQVVELLGCLILADGASTLQEGEKAYLYLHEFYEKSDADKMWEDLTTYLKSESQKIALGTYQQPNIEHVAGEIYYDNNMGEKEFLRLLSALYQIAAADHCIKDSELEIIHIYVKKTRINYLDNETLANRYKRNTKNEQDSDSYQKEKKQTNPKIVNIEWAYAILCLPIGASQDKIKESYHQLAMEYHPDRHAKESEERIQFYNEKFKHVNEAYRLLCQ